MAFAAFLLLAVVFSAIVAALFALTLCAFQTHWLLGIFMVLFMIMISLWDNGEDPF